MIKIKCSETELNNCQGVYIFKNLINGKCYIGSTVMSFKKRLEHHLWHLRNNKHKNNHFQSAWNKYGEDAFEYSILEICDKTDCLNKEQYYLNTILHADDFLNHTSNLFLQLGYNINPLSTGTPNLSKETINKRTKTFKEYVSQASSFYKQLKNYEIDFDDIPEKYISIISGWYNNIPWNKGISYESTDHLKVPKTITKKVLNARKIKSENARNKSDKILIFDINKKYLCKWRSPIDIYEWSITDKNNLPIILKGKSKTKELLPQNLAKSCKTGKPYKGLYFKYEQNALFESDFKNEENKNGEVWNDDTVLTYSIAKGE